MLGALGAIAALAAAPTPASALTVVYDNYGASGGWASAVSGTIYEYTCIPDNTTGCGGSATGTAVSSIPIGGTTTVNNGSSGAGVTLFSEQAATTSPWNSFWPLQLKTGGTYNGDVWTSNAFANGSPVTSVTLNLTPSMGNLGFVVNPEGLASGTTFTIAVTWFGGDNTTTYYEKERIIGTTVACSVPTGQPNQGNFANGLAPSARPTAASSASRAAALRPSQSRSPTTPASSARLRC
jgi:hypothetical protein